MVHIELPVHIQAGGIDSSLQRLGITLEYTETPLTLEALLTSDFLPLFQECIQYKEGDPQDTVAVDIINRPVLLQTLLYIFAMVPFITDMSVEMFFVDHLSGAFGAALAKCLGLSAISSNVQIPPTEDLYVGIAESLLTNMESSATLRQFLFEQYLQQSPDRFYPGKNDTYAPIPFAPGDSLSFFLTLHFRDAIVNGAVPLLDFLAEEDIPVLKYIVKFSFAS